ncbi:MAG TPA: YidC/Oxa1 family membrane protein insertase [Solirubrobacterales bacterium]|nr:YidC/Oxa1 family membrane protein insertase [Solirubrobacterales bacterium]
MILPLAHIFQPLIDAAEAVLKFFHDDVGVSWGLSIVLLTFVTRIVILPLSVKQIRSMRALQAYQPQIKEIQEKYKDDRQRLQRELMGFYQENKINPFASCVPLLLQIPVFISLYALLRGSSFKEDVGSAGFLFIPNLTEAATGAVLATLIVLFIATQLGAGMVMAATADRQQRILMFALPLIIVPFIVRFPAGLVVYWITTNVWTLGQQYVVKRVLPAPDQPTPEQVKAVKPPPPPPRKRKRRR